MVVDTSVLVHILLKEDGWESSFTALDNQARKYVSVASVIEVQAVLASRVEGDSKRMLDDLLIDLEFEIVPLSVKQSDLARVAYLAYGKGQGHKAQLNYGDVMVYALAKDYGESLAFVGNDFNQTDLKVVQFPV